MLTNNLYQIEKEDFERLKELLTVCFMNDPLYQSLIPSLELRKRLLPQLFECDIEEFFETCEIYADSSELNGIIIISDEMEPYNHFRYYISELLAEVRTDTTLIKEDPSLKTLWNFIRGKEYLNSKWTDELEDENRLHIIYLAVHPQMRHKGITHKLISEVLSYADEHEMSVSLETHNIHNLAIYEHYGFHLFEIVQKEFELKQYCLVREARESGEDGVAL